MTTTDLKKQEDYQFCQKVIEKKQQIEGAFISLGEDLLDTRENRKFEAMGYDNFNNWCSSELKMNPSVASRIINIYKRFVLEYGIEKERIAKLGGWSYVAELLPVADSKEEAEHWVGVAENCQTRSDLRDEIKEDTKGVRQMDCQHENVVIQRICKDCGSKFTKDEE